MTRHLTESWVIGRGNFAASSAYPLYLFFTIVIITFGIGATMVLEAFNITTLGFIFNAALLGGFSTAVYVPLTLYVNLKHLPLSERPKPLNIAMMSIASLV